MDRATRLSPLGLQRLRVLECLGGNSPEAPGYFVPGEDVDIFAAFRRYVGQMWQRWAAESDPLALSLLAAARLLTGDLSVAEVIVDHLPASATKLDHGAGFCVVMPLVALRTALPLPKDLGDTRRWLAGSAEQAALREWLGEHRTDLRWFEEAGDYRLVGGG